MFLLFGLIAVLGVKYVYNTLKEGGMRGAGGSWGGGGGGPWDGMVVVVGKVEIVSVDVKPRGAVVASLRCMRGEGIV